MPRRISWKKGMRLTDEVLLAADACAYEHIGQALRLTAGGRFGLVASGRPFNLQLSITKGFVDVEALDCMAITRGGYLIDIRSDSKFTTDFDGRVQIPEKTDEKEFFLVVLVSREEWKDNADGFREPEYTFGLATANTELPDNAMPIAHIIYEDGWREDNTRFVPPCLLVSSHPKFEELQSQFVALLRNLDETLKAQVDTGAYEAVQIFWPVVREMLIVANTERELFSPPRLLACVQRVVGSFAMACDFVEEINLGEADTFNNYARVSYNYRNAYIRIKQGLGMCYAINEKAEKFQLLEREKPVSVLPPPPPEPEPEPKKPEPPKPDPRRIWDGKRI